MAETPRKFAIKPLYFALEPPERIALCAAALLLAYTRAAAPFVDGRQAIGFAAAEAHALALIDNALKGVPSNPALPDLMAFGIRACRSCGCTDEVACPEGCAWVDKDLCSACAAGEPAR